MIEPSDSSFLNVIDGTFGTAMNVIGQMTLCKYSLICILN